MPSEPELPLEQKRYLDAFDAFLASWASEDEQLIIETRRRMREALPAALWKAPAVVALVRRGAVSRERDAGLAVELLFADVGGEQ